MRLIPGLLLLAVIVGLFVRLAEVIDEPAAETPVVYECPESFRLAAADGLQICVDGAEEFEARPRTILRSDLAREGGPALP